MEIPFRAGSKPSDFAGLLLGRRPPAGRRGRAAARTSGGNEPPRKRRPPPSRLPIRPRRAGRGRPPCHRRQHRGLRPGGQSAGDRSSFAHGHCRRSGHGLGDGTGPRAFPAVFPANSAPGNERGRQGARAVQTSPGTIFDSSFQGIGVVAPIFATYDASPTPRRGFITMPWGRSSR